MNLFTWINENVVQPVFARAMVVISDVAGLAEWIVTNPLLSLGAPLALWLTLGALSRLENRRRS